MDWSGGGVGGVGDARKLVSWRIGGSFERTNIPFTVAGDPHPDFNVRFAPRGI